MVIYALDILRGYRSTVLTSRYSMYRDSEYITLYKSPHSKIYSMNSIYFFCDIQRKYNATMIRCLILHFNTNENITENTNSSEMIYVYDIYNNMVGSCSIIIVTVVNIN